MVTRERNATLPGTAEFGAYFEAASKAGAVFASITDEGEDAFMTKGLSWTERATARINVAAPTTRPSEFGLLHEANLRLGVLKVRGVLDRISLHEVARNLQTVFFSTHPRHMIYAVRGWRLLELLDAAGMVEVTLSTPDPNDARRFIRVRLHARMSQIRQESNFSTSAVTASRRRADRL